jgi:pimeloyl-ACP methyl ester carboxylesterase
MKNFGMIAAAMSVGLMSLPLIVAQQPATPAAPGAPAARGGRGAAQPPPKPTADQERLYQTKISEIDAIVRSLRARKVNDDLIADVDIFAKAGKWLLEFPQGFGNEQGIDTYLAVLEQGLARGRQLQHGQSPWVLEKGRKVLGYYSALDGSVQPMGVTVPDTYNPQRAERLYVWLHGRNNNLTEASFINGIKNVPQFPNTAYTADVGQLTLDCYGRGNNANHQAGEVDIFEGIEAMQRRFKVDPDRVILRGFSLGGAGAWHIALHYPDRWAAAEIGAGTYPGRLMYAATPFPPYQHGPLHIYENIIDWALNASNLPLAGHDGDADNQVATVGAARGNAPTPNRGQLESSLRVRAQLAKEGFPSEGPEGNWTVKGTRNIYLISANTQHGVNREVKTKLDAFLKEHGDRGRQVPDRIRFLTYTTRYNECFWVTLDGLEKHYERAEVDAERTADRKQYQITTKNLTRLTLRETTKATEIKIDGQVIPVKPASVTVLEKIASQWRVSKDKKWPGLHKTHALQGPIDDAFLSPFLLVRPTGNPWNEEANKHALRMLEHFDRVYAMNYRAHPRIKDDTDVTPADFVMYNVVLFGDPGSNKWIGKTHSKLPLKWTRESVTVAGKAYPASENLPVLAYPNPLNPSRYVVINTGLTISDQDYNADYAMPRFGDIAVLKIKDTVQPPEIVWAGLFDESWRLPKTAN